MEASDALNKNTIFDDFNKEQHYFSLFESYSYFPKPSKYVMEQVKASPTNSSYGEEQKIVKSTLEGLVIHLTNPVDSIDYNELHDFFIVYRNFMTSERLLEIVLYRLKWSITKILPIKLNSLNRYSMNNIPTLGSGNGEMNGEDEELNKLYAIIVIRVFVMIRHWITNYFIEDFLYNDVLFYSFVTFFDNEISQNLLPLLANCQDYKNLKMILNCIVTLKKQWVCKLNECFIEPYYKNIPDNSQEDWIRYNLVIGSTSERTKLHNSKRLSIFALKNSIDPTSRNQSFIGIIGKKSVLLPNAEENKVNLLPLLTQKGNARSVSRSKQSVLFPKNFNYMTAYKNELHKRNTSDDSNTITSNYRNFSGISTSKNTSLISDPNQQMSVIDIPKNNKRMISLSSNGESSVESENLSSNLDFVQVLNVPESSKIDTILPSTPAKKLEFTISLDDLIDDQKNYFANKEDTHFTGSDLSVRQSIYGLLNKWGTTSETVNKRAESNISEVESLASFGQEILAEEPVSEQQVSPNDTNEVNKFVRYVFSIAAINGNENLNGNLSELKNKEYVKNLIKEGEHRFDILSARSIDEVQYIINRENAQLETDNRTPLKHDHGADAIEPNQMDNLNLYNTVVKIANSVLSSNMKSTINNNPDSKRMSRISLTEKIQQTPLHLNTDNNNDKSSEYASPDKASTNHLNFTTSPFLRSIEKTKTEIVNRDWINKSLSPKKSSSHSIEIGNSPLKRGDPLTPTPAKRLSALLDTTLPSELNNAELHLKLPESQAANKSDSVYIDEANETILELPSTSLKGTPTRSFSDTNYSKGHLRNASIQSYQSVYSLIKQDLPKVRNSGRISISSGNANNHGKPPTRYASLKLEEFHTSDINQNENGDNNLIFTGSKSKTVSRASSILGNKSFADKDELFQQQENELKELGSKISSSSLRKASFSPRSKSQRNSGVNLKPHEIFNHSKDITPFESPLLSHTHIKMSPTFTNINDLISDSKQEYNPNRISSGEKDFVSATSSINTDLLFHDAVSSQATAIPKSESVVLNNQQNSADIPRRLTAGLNLHLSGLESIMEPEYQHSSISEMNQADEAHDGLNAIKNNKQTDLRKIFKEQFQNSDVSDSRLSLLLYGDDDYNNEFNGVDTFEKKHDLDTYPEDIVSYNSGTGEQAANDKEVVSLHKHSDYTAFEGDNPLEIAMKKLEGTFDELEYEIEKESQASKSSEDININSDAEELSEDEMNVSNPEFIVSSDNSKPISKSKSVNNIMFDNKRSSILIQNRRKTLLTTTNLTEVKQKSLFDISSDAAQNTNKTAVNETQISTGMYINDLLLDYKIRDDTLLISNHKEHIPFIMMYSSKDIAHQMTLIERDVLNEVDWKSLLQLQMNENLKSYTSWLEVLVNQDELSGIDLGVARFNLTVDWIISEIVLTNDIKLKRNVLQKYIHVAENCIKLQNFNTSMQIVLALSSIEVQHFKESWRLVEPGDMLTWAEMKNLFSSDYNDYKGLRELMNDMDPIKGCLPFLVLYLSDLKNLANISTFFQSNHDIVNYQKFHSLATIVKNFIQRVSWGIEFYQLELHPQLLSKCLYISALKEEEISHIINGGYY